MSHAEALVWLTDREHRIRRAAIRLLEIEQGDTERAIRYAKGTATHAGADADFWLGVAGWLQDRGGDARTEAGVTS